MIVTKNVSAERINDAIKAGATDLGENRIQEARSKRPLLKTTAAIRHHFLGTLQTNKVRKALELFDMIQSVDRPRVAEVLNRLSGECGRPINVLAEIKVSEEAAKSGVPLNQAGDFLRSFASYPHLKCRGLMTIAPYGVSERQTRECFRRLKGFFDDHRGRFGREPVLSMGMSDDYEIAIEEGATMVRIGRAVFGERKT